MKKVAIIGIIGVPANYGGFETLAENLIRKKSKVFDFTVYTSSITNQKRVKHFCGAKLKYWPLKASGVQSIAYDILSMFHAVRHSDVLLVLGVSGCIVMPIVKLVSKKKVIVNTDGLEWKREKWGKPAKALLKFSEKMAVKYADEIVADNVVIQNHIESIYNRKSSLIPYGGDHACQENISSNTLAEFPFVEKQYAFKVCRIVPENNIHLILSGFAVYEGLNLVMVGNWENSDYGKVLRKRFAKVPNLFLLDPIYDQQKLNQLRSNCFVYLHGHSAGGTNPSLVEAMHLGLPILAYGADYNKETTGNRAMYFYDENSLLEMLKSLNEQKNEEVAAAMHQIAKESYTWEKVANEYSILFKN